MVSNISRALSLIDPEHQYTYAENARRYCARLDSLDKAISAMLIHKQKRTFIVYHSAWNYFARDYDLEQRTIEVGGKEPSAKIIQNIIEVARQQNIHVLFASPQFDHKYAEAIARDINGQVILVDPLAKNYIENIGNISTSLVRYLE
jgi:zinc transport system substrate-binding protein